MDFEADREVIWASLVEEIEACPAEQVVLSSEEFDCLSADEIAELGRRLRAYAINPVLFLRNYADFLKSSFRTSVIHGNYRAHISDFVKDQRTRLDYKGLIRDWASLGKVTVVAYDDPLVSADVVTCFVSICGLDASLVNVNGIFNESVPAFICEIVRYMRGKGVGPSHIAAWIDRMRKVPFAAGANTRYCLLPSDLRAQLDDRYRTEIGSVLGSDAPYQRLIGHLALPSRDGVSCEIRNSADALLALGKELSLKVA